MKCQIVFAFLIILGFVNGNEDNESFGDDFMDDYQNENESQKGCLSNYTNGIGALILKFHQMLPSRSYEIKYIVFDGVQNQEMLDLLHILLSEHFFSTLTLFTETKTYKTLREMVCKYMHFNINDLIIYLMADVPRYINKPWKSQKIESSSEIYANIKDLLPIKEYKKLYEETLTKDAALRNALNVMQSDTFENKINAVMTKEVFDYLQKEFEEFSIYFLKFLKYIQDVFEAQKNSNLF